LETQLSGMDEEASRQALERRLERLRELSEYALPLIRRLAALPRAAVWGDWISALTDLAGEAIREPVAVAAVLEELHPMATLGPVGLAGVLRVLADRLTNLRLEPPARRFGRVFVGSVEDARGMQFHTVFLPGLAEGLFPRRVTEDPLLLDDVREQLPGLVRNRTRAERERLLLQIATGAGTRLDVSYPRMDSAQSRPRVPSFYALEVARLAEGHFPRLDEFRQKARGAADARLGWPAPSRPEQAIDDAEYDLAVLAGERVRGMARYMVEANPALGRSLRIRWNRWEKRNWNDADGLIGPVPALARHQLAARPYSATALQRFAVCPYQFLLHSIHRLQEREVPSAIERLDALTRGVLFHEVLRRFLDAQDPDADLAEALDLADRTLDSVAETFAEDLAPAIPRVWQSEMEDIRGDVRGWLREMSRERAWQPVSWEQEFDADLDGRARLSGRIDLLERHTVTSVLRITDHKTGKPPAERPAFLGQGELMQPLLYAMAAEKSLGATVSGGRLFYCTQRGEYQEAFVPLSETARAHAAEALEIIGQATRDGSFPAAPRAGACAVCPYRAVCGPYEEERARKKNPAGLESLARLRSIP
jgi:RecB family exonuclease